MGLFSSVLKRWYVVRAVIGGGSGCSIDEIFVFNRYKVTMSAFHVLEKRVFKSPSYLLVVCLRKAIYDFQFGCLSKTTPKNVS